MDYAGNPRRSYRNDTTKNGERRERQSRRLQRRYKYDGAGSALIVLAVAIVLVILFTYLTSKGISITANFFSSVLGIKP